MYEIHASTDGNMMICQMADDHLMNEIGRLCNVMMQARLTITQAAAFQDPILRSVARIKPEDVQKEAESQIRRVHDRLQPYVMEAALRGLGISGLLQTTYGRKSAYPRPSLTLLQSTVEED